MVKILGVRYANFRSSDVPELFDGAGRTLSPGAAWMPPKKFAGAHPWLPC